MSGTERPRPPLSRLARVLDLEPDDLADLKDIPDEDLRTLYEQVNHALYAEGKHAYARVANLSRTVPGPVAGKLAEKFLPAFLAARVAEQLPPHKARDLVTKVSLGYLADIAMVLDPVGAQPVIQELPAGRIGEVARVLFDREAYAAMVDFTWSVTTDALLAALDQATSADLVAVLPMIEWGPALDEVLDRLTDAKVDAVVQGMSAGQLADLAVAMDLGPLQPILEGLSPAAVQTAATELFAREEFTAVAGLAGAVPPSLIAIAVDVASPQDLAAILPLVSWEAELTSVILSLPQEKIDEVIAGLSTQELADLAVATDLRPLRPLLGSISTEAVESVAKELFARKSYAALAGLATAIPAELLSAAIEVASAEELSAVVPLLEQGPELDAALLALPPDRLTSLRKSLGPKFPEPTPT